MMDLPAILAALRRNGLGALLIAMQIALTVTIVCNSLSIIQQRLARAQRPTGIDEPNIFSLNSRWLGDASERAARVRADTALLRALPGVIDATAGYAIPLGGGGETGWVTLTAEQKTPTAWTGSYFADEHALNAFGARLIAGRWFTAADLDFVPSPQAKFPSVAIVTRALANAMYPSGDALGKSFYYVGVPLRVIGIVDTLEAPVLPLSFGEPFIENSLFLPFTPTFAALGDTPTYVVRTRPGQRDAVMRLAPDKLVAASRARIIANVQPFSLTRAKAYRGARSLSLILGTVSVLLLIVTALGIVGLTSYWVGQRRRQIGVRRALGASRADILSYFHFENFLIAGFGAVVGVTLALFLNSQITNGLHVTPLSAGFAAVVALGLFVLSQLAVLWPAWRAASLPPAIAARGA